MIQVQPKDKPWLLKRFRHPRRLRDRVAAAWLLGYIGDDEVFRVLSEYVLYAPSERAVSDEDLGAFTAPLRALGITAQTNAAALAFLKQAVSPGWWRKNRHWRQTRMEISAGPALAGVAIEALGLTGRREAEQFLDQLTEEDLRYVFPEDKKQVWTYESSLCQAKCYLRVCQQMGLAGFRAHLFDAEYHRLALAWRKSEEGLRLLEKQYPKDRYPEIWRRVDARAAEIETVQWPHREDIPLNLKPFK
jgi:hypothetical protein